MLSLRPPREVEHRERPVFFDCRSVIGASRSLACLKGSKIMRRVRIVADLRNPFRTRFIDATKHAGADRTSVSRILAKVAKTQIGAPVIQPIRIDVVHKTIRRWIQNFAVHTHCGRLWTTAPKTCRYVNCANSIPSVFTFNRGPIKRRKGFKISLVNYGCHSVVQDNSLDPIELGSLK